MRSRCYRGIVQLATFLLPSVLGSVSFGSSLGFDAIVPTDGCGVRELRTIGVRIAEVPVPGMGDSGRSDDRGGRKADH